MPSTAATLNASSKAKKPVKPLKAPAITAPVTDIAAPKPVGMPINKTMSKTPKNERKQKLAKVKEFTPQDEVETLLLNEVITVAPVEAVIPETTVEVTPVEAVAPVVEETLVPEIITSFSIDEFRSLMNSTLANSTCSAEMRKGMIVALETVLYKSGRFNGTRPLTTHEIPMGHRPGVNIDPTTGHVLENYTARDAGTDKTRVEYL